MLSRAVAAQQYCDNPPTHAGCPLQAEADATEQLTETALATLHDAAGAPMKQMPDGYTIDMRSGLM